MKKQLDFNVNTFAVTGHVVLRFKMRIFGIFGIRLYFKTFFRFFALIN